MLPTLRLGVKSRDILYVLSLDILYKSAKRGAVRPLNFWLSPFDLAIQFRKHTLSCAQSLS